MPAKKPAKKIKKLIYIFSQLLVRLFLKILFGYRYTFAEPLAKGCPMIFASNHASYFDPPCVGAAIIDFERDIFFMAKLELFKSPFFGSLIRFYNAVPIRRGVMDWKALAQVKTILKGGEAIILFPEGTRSKDGKLGEAKFGVGMLAQETGATIVPVYARGTDRLLDAFLRRRTMKICFGLAIGPEEYVDFDRSTQGQLAISRMVMQRIAALKESCEA